jgi:hypothetical protein
MAVSSVYENRVRTALVRFAARGRFPFYSQSGFGPRGPRKEVLDLISRKERRLRRPDITYILRNRRWGYPSQIEFQDARPPKPWQIARARTHARRIIRMYAPVGTVNPY